MPQEDASGAPAVGRMPYRTTMTVNVVPEVKEILRQLAAPGQGLGHVISWLARSEQARREERARWKPVPTADEEQRTE
jgi:hypothetical protein